MEKFTAPYFEARLYIGSNTHYNGAPFSELDLMRAVGAFQEENKVNDKLVPVRITSTRYVCGDYNEHGWEVAIINYPRAPRQEVQLEGFIHTLAEHLLERFQQNRISVIVTPFHHYDYSYASYPHYQKITMYQADDAEESHMEDNPPEVHIAN